MKTTRIFLLFLGFLPTILLAQIPIGSWSGHLPFNDVISVAEGDNIIYAATNFAVFTYNENDNSVSKISTIQGLPETGISRISFNKQINKLLIAFEDGNISIIEDENEIVNVPAILNSSILGDKEIYNITMAGKYAYLACGFGIVKFDMQQDEIAETYIYGNNNTPIKTNDVAVYDDTLYAAGNNGIYCAALNNPNLTDFNAWHKMNVVPPSGKISFLATFSNKLFAVKDTSAYDKDSIFYYEGGKWFSFSPMPQIQVNDMNVSDGFLVFSDDYQARYFNDSLLNYKNIWEYGSYHTSVNTAIVDANGIFWIGDKNNGLVKAKSSYNYQFLSPNGPLSNDGYQMRFSDENLWVVSGELNSTYHNTYHAAGFYHFANSTWNSIVRPNAALDSIYDIVDLAIDPKDPNHIFGASWGNGLVEIKDNQVVNVYNSSNSPIKSNPIYQHYAIGGLAYDKDGNLWMSNDNTDYGLVVLEKNGTWNSFNLYPYSDNTSPLSRIAIDNQGKIWILNPVGNSVIVFDDGGTINDKSDDKVVELTVANGFIPEGSYNYCITKDKDGNMWVGTNQGPIVFNNTGSVMQMDPSAAAQQILLTQDGNVQILLETAQINAIAVDGANQKWIGTESGGIFLMSADGTKQILHFDKSNSPLFSNEIHSIAINKDNGEVFIGTGKGIISYGGEATEGKTSCDSVYAFPNPVTHEYNGKVAIRGLFPSSDVRITDAAGHLVFKTTALGGQAIWDGNNMHGQRVNTGIYPVFCTSKDGDNTCKTKIMVIN